MSGWQIRNGDEQRGERKRGGEGRREKGVGVIRVTFEVQCRVVLSHCRRADCF